MRTKQNQTSSSYLRFTRLGIRIAVCLMVWPYLGNLPNVEAVEYKKPGSGGTLYAEPLFEVTTLFKGRYYLYSMHDAEDWDNAQEICGWYGGYLAEIDDEEENRFLKDMPFWRSDRPGDLFVLGGSDKEKEGHWVFPRTGKPIKGGLWNWGEPNNEFDREHCQTFVMWGTKLEMNDLPCYPVYPSTTATFRFICEIPLTK